MLIGEVSKRTGCKIETIRYYEREGIKPSPARTEGGHRVYNNQQLRRLFFVRRCRELGFSLDQVRSLLSLVDSREYSCDEVREITLSHVNDVKRRIADLNKMKRVLSDMASSCVGGNIPDCPIIGRLFRDAS